jgi:hypothetical protein
MMLPARDRLIAHLLELVRYGGGSLLVLGVKIGLMQLAMLALDELPAYALVQVGVFAVSYLLHSRFTFGTELNWSSAWRYGQTLVVFQLLDWIIFAVIFTRYRIDSTVVILIGTVIVFLLRFVFVRRSLRRPPV